MIFKLGLTLPSTYGGALVPEFESWVEKDGEKVLTASAVDCNAAAVSLEAPLATAATVEVSWGVDPS